MAGIISFLESILMQVVFYGFYPLFKKTVNIKTLLQDVGVCAVKSWSPLLVPACQNAMCKLTIFFQ
jgi:hypothetical protein